MRWFLGYLIGFGLIAFGALALVGQVQQGLKTNNSDDIFAGLFLGGLLGFAGIVTLIAVRRRRATAFDSATAAATVWAVGMNTALGDSAQDGDAGTED